jgi:hypothetical protein
MLCDAATHKQGHMRRCAMWTSWRGTQRSAGFEILSLLRCVGGSKYSTQISPLGLVFWTSADPSRPQVCMHHNADEYETLELLIFVWKLTPAEKERWIIIWVSEGHGEMVGLWWYYCHILYCKPGKNGYTQKANYCLNVQVRVHPTSSTCGSGFK